MKKKSTKKSTEIIELSSELKELSEMLNSGEIQRRHIRYKLFLIKWKKPLDETEIKLKEYIQSQFKQNQTWDGFTFDWDVGCNNPLKVITMEEWVGSGGTFDNMGRRNPPAFTQQK